MSKSMNRIGWDDIEACADALAAGLPGACGVAAFDRVVAVARGGMIPAVLVATRLGVKRVESVQVRLYDGDRQLEAPTLIGAPPISCGPSGEPRNTLIVDELVDSGSTMRHLGVLLPQAQRATLVARGRGASQDRVHGLLPWACEPANHGRPIWVARSVDTERWILFPWSSARDVAAAGGSS